MVDVRGDVLRPPHGTTPAAVEIPLDWFLVYVSFILNVTYNYIMTSMFTNT